jgi:hypothetical protein
MNTSPISTAEAFLTGFSSLDNYAVPAYMKTVSRYLRKLAYRPSERVVLDHETLFPFTLGLYPARHFFHSARSPLVKRNAIRFSQPMLRKTRLSAG